MAPPGGLLSPGLSAAVAPWCIGLITGKDAVPRLSITTGRLLMDHCVFTLAMCKLPKMQCALSVPASAALHATPPAQPHAHLVPSGVFLRGGGGGATASASPPVQSCAGLSSPPIWARQ